MTKYLLPAIFTMTLIATSCTDVPQTKIQADTYPKTDADSTIVDNYFGHKVADPYRWLEDDKSTQTADWVKAENHFTQNYLSKIPFRKAIQDRLTELYNYPRQSAPWRVGEYYFFYKNNGLQNQSVLYFQKGLEGTPEIFLDPNTLSEDGTIALGEVTFSNDDKYCAYTTSKSGSDWLEIHMMEIPSRKLMPEVISWVKFNGASWGKDGFYYSRYNEPKGSALSEINEFQKVYFHKLGTEQSADVLIYEDPKHPLRYFNAHESKDGKWLFIHGAAGTSGAEILYKSTANKRGFSTLFSGFISEYMVVDVKDDKALFLTNDKAPNYRLLEVDLKNQQMTRDVIAQSEDLLQWVTTAGGNIFAGHLRDASTRVSQYTYQGSLVRQIELPGIGTAMGFSGKKDDTEVFYTFSSFNMPHTSYKYSIVDGTSEVYKQAKVNFDASQFTVEQVFYTSKDSTKVPMFIVYKKGLKRDSSAPTLLYAYGGFNASLTPSFSAANILLMEQGGIYALANIRGGGEYGEQWHEGGMLEKKQNVFDDFIAAAEYLVAEKYTSSSKLAISGGSNGGLLVGACMVQRPDLYAVAFPQVGVLDMMRYHKFTVGWGWAVEYGSSDVEAQYDYLIKYSPLHNVRTGVEYPATMIMTADHDDRVVPAHSFKFAATLQAAQMANTQMKYQNPILINIESNAGHGAGKPIGKVIEAQADLWGFMFWNTETQYKSTK